LLPFVAACLFLQLEWPLEDTIRWVRERNLPLIIDGSGLNFIATRLHLVKGYTNCILTPNIAEFGRLAQGAGVQLEGPMGTPWQKHVSHAD
jgi:NAD(P)H-hydrate repair Nnr-like enzyme with NAD(P)H-hydrate dehydratase domain